MSDIRTKLLLGTSISSVTIMLFMAAGFATNTTELFTTELILPLNGHVTVMAVNPDGTVSYAQGDNFILDPVRTWQHLLCMILLVPELMLLSVLG